MFRKWLNENKIDNYDFFTPVFPKGSDREYWNSLNHDAHIKEAENYLGFDWPIIKAADYITYRTTGNRTQQEIPHFTRRTALISLVLGEICEYKGRFIPDIVDGLFLICEETFWGVSAHYPNHVNDMLPDAENCYIDLFVGETASTVALTYYLLYDELNDYCPDILKRIEYEMERRVFKPYLSSRDFVWMGYYNDVNNWNPWVLSNMMTAFLLMEHSPSRLRRAIKKMIYEIEKIYVAYPEDGGCDEGANYWAVSGGTLFEFLYMLYIASDKKIDFFDDQKIKNIMQYCYHTYIKDGRYVNFADGTPFIQEQAASLIYLYGKINNDGKLIELARRIISDNKKIELTHYSWKSYAKRELFMLMYGKELNEKDNFKALNNFIYQNLQIAYLRDGELYCAAKGGHNFEGHNHNDVGSFILYDGSTPVLIDPGCGEYTANTFNHMRYTIWTMQSDWHNLPKINGYSQHNGSTFRAKSFALENGTISVEFKDAYMKEAALDSCKRDISFKENALTVEDTFVFSQSANEVCEHFITVVKPFIQDNKVHIGDYILNCNTAADISYDHIDFNGDEKLENSWNTDKLYRIKFKFVASDDLSVKFEVKKEI